MTPRIFVIESLFMCPGSGCGSEMDVSQNCFKEKGFKKIFVQINCAATVDGKIATKERNQIRISSGEDMERVHGLRSRFDAVAVGVETLLSDDPRLTAVNGVDPLRVIFDSEGRTPLDSQVFKTGGSRVVVAVTGKASRERIEGLERGGAEVFVSEGEKTDIGYVLDKLAGLGVDSLLVEGGGELNWGFIEEGVVDKVSVYVAGKLFGGRSAPTVVDGEGFVENNFAELELLSTDVLGNGVLMEWRVLDE